MKRFENKVVFITGGTSGIGRSSAILAAREGAKIALVDLHENAAVVEEIKKEGAEVKFIACNVANHDEVERAVADTIATFGSLDIALNNAGITDKSMAPIHDKPLEEWQKVQDVNLNGVFYCMKHQLVQMRKQASGGSIVNMGSSMSVAVMEGIASYVASKHAVLGLSQTAALENAIHNIRVNVIGPGYIATPLLLAGIPDEQTRKYMESLHPMNRLGEPEEIAKAFLFLASDDASFITGVYLPVDGGYLIK